MNYLGGWGLIFVVWIDRFFCWGASICLEGGSFSSRSQRSRGLGIARVRGRRGGRDAPEAPPLVIAEADAALSAQRLRSDTAVKRGVRGGNLPKVALNWGERWGKSKV